MRQGEFVRDPGGFWRVQPGDTIYSIALATGTTVERLLELNPTVNPENLVIGSVLSLPLHPGLPQGPVPQCESGIYWVVSPGDTLYLIAKEVGTTVEALLRLNPSIDPLNLQPGQSICLPLG